MASVSDLTKQVQKFSIDNSPLLLTAVGAAGVITTAYLSAKGAIKAERILEEHMPKDPVVGFTKREYLALTWQCYVPACGIGLVTVASIVGANHIGTRRAAAMATAVSISEKAFAEYREKVVEKIGSTKEKQVVDAAAQERVTRDHNSEVIIFGGGDQLCYDSYSGRFFKSDMETLKSAVNRLNHQIINQNYASLSDFYNYVGLEKTQTSDEIGWNVDKLLDVHFSTVLTPDGKPAISLEYRAEPIRDYFRLH